LSRCVSNDTFQGQSASEDAADRAQLGLPMRKSNHAWRRWRRRPARNWVFARRADHSGATDVQTLQDSVVRKWPENMPATATFMPNGRCFGDKRQRHARATKAPGRGRQPLFFRRREPTPKLSRQPAGTSRACLKLQPSLSWLHTRHQQHSAWCGLSKRREPGVISQGNRFRRRRIPLSGQQRRQTPRIPKRCALANPYLAFSALPAGPASTATPIRYSKNRPAGHRPGSVLSSQPRAAGPGFPPVPVSLEAPPGGLSGR